MHAPAPLYKLHPALDWGGQCIGNNMARFLQKTWALKKTAGEVARSPIPLSHVNPSPFPSLTYSVLLVPTFLMEMQLTGGIV